MQITLHSPWLPKKEGFSMKHTFIRKPLSVLLSILMVLSVFGGMAFPAGAESKTIAAAPFSALAVPEGTPLTDQLPSTQG
ncbi:MAG: surface glycoprotein, partial [Clostridia bacterium]|nr:surface glycoprotein [Clostridia bacterium]